MTNKEAIGFYAKMNLVRGDLLSLDWKDDKFLSLGGRSGYNYLSIDKIKRNLAPVLQQRGLDLGIEYCDLTQLGDVNAAVQHWTVTLKASLIDIESGYERVYTAYGESSDHGDKGVNKAQTAAMKQFLSNTFLLIDGIDPDAEDKASATTVSFNRSPMETLVAKSKILDKAIKTPTVSVSNTDNEASENAKEAPAEEQKPAENIEAESKTEAPAVEPSEVPVEGCAFVPLVAESIKDLKVTGPQRGAISRIIETRTKMAMEGQLTPAEYNQMSADYADIKDQASGTAFISKYRVVGKLA